jgi:hypothetical protein
MVKFHQKWSWQKVIFQVDYLEIGGKIGEISKYKVFAHKAYFYTSQIPNRTCLNCHCTVTLAGFEKDFLVISLKTHFH